MCCFVSKMYRFVVEFMCVVLYPKCIDSSSSSCVLLCMRNVWIRRRVYVCCYVYRMNGFIVEFMCVVIYPKCIDSSSSSCMWNVWIRRRVYVCCYVS